MNKFFAFLAVAILLVACSDSPKTDDTTTNQDERQALISEIQDLRQQTFEEEVRFDRAVAHDLMKKNIAFANSFPSDSLTPGLLFEAASVGQRLGRFKQSINLLENVHEGYPSFDKRVESVFLIGFIYQDDLNDRIMAEEYYNKVIELYPESEWADQARASLVTLNMTDDQLLDFLKTQNSVDANP